ncbi:MAG: YqgE/AlgH family protein [Candidatus Poriferisodalaceae bacterium]|nr:MAG: hypothetical protein CNE88_07695 [Acidimicrobiales bacterium MED-G01]
MAQPLVTPVVVPDRGCLLVATPQLEDPNFRRSVVLMIEHGPEGSLGVVLNRPSTESLESLLPTWLTSELSSPTVLVGGPVQPDALLALVPTSSVVSGSSKITEQISMLDLEVDMDLTQIDINAVRFYFGYAGWSPGQLRLEIEEGAWWTFDSTPDELTCDPSECWRSVLARQRSAARLLSIYPDQSYLN